MTERPILFSGPMVRALSSAEQAGWRRFWDGWVICPACMPGHGAGYTPETWRVPADYDTPIKDDAACMTCRQSPAALSPETDR